MIVKRTQDERKAYLEGYLMCVRNLQRYLTDEGKQKLEGFIEAVKIKTEADNIYDYKDLYN